MPTPIEQLILHLERSREQLAAAVHAVDPAIRQAKPPSGGWSVAEVVQHLVHTDYRFGLLVTKSTSGLRPARDDVDVDGILQSRKLRAVLDRTVKVESVAAIMPTETWNAEHAWAMLVQARAALLTIIRSVDGLPLSQVTHRHHILGELNLYEWIAFLGAHETRHAAQINEISLAIGCAPSL